MFNEVLSLTDLAVCQQKDIFGIAVLHICQSMSRLKTNDKLLQFHYFFELMLNCYTTRMSQLKRMVCRIANGEVVFFSYTLDYCKLGKHDECPLFISDKHVED